MASLGPVACQSLRHVLVGRAQGGALGIERGIVLIGLDQRPFERVRRCLAASDADGSHSNIAQM
jgi:hypothetical protein